MPNRASPKLLLYPSYRYLLDLLTESAMVLARLLVADMQASPGFLSQDDVSRSYLIISTVVRRSIVISRHLDTVPTPVEEKEGRIMPALDRVLLAFAAHKMDIETYHAAIDRDLDQEADDELELEGYDVERRYDPDADVPLRRPCVLVAELCRDFGLVSHLLPPNWLDPVPPDLRLLCARAAAAAIRPSPKPARLGHLMER